MFKKMTLNSAGPEQVSTCEVPCSSNDFFVPNHRIFHCLIITQNSPNLESAQIFYNLLPLWISTTGGAIIKESVCCLITPIYFITYSKTLYPHVRWIVSHGIGHANICLSVGFFPFFLKFAKCRKPTFSTLLPVISPISTKLCTQHLWTLLT